MIYVSFLNDEDGLFVNSTDIPLIEILYYNNLCNLTTIHSSGHLFMVKSRIIFDYIEREMPTINPYEFMNYVDCHSHVDNMINDDFLLNEKRIIDILEQIKQYNYDDYDLNCSSSYTIEAFIKFFVNCHKQNFFDFFKINIKGDVKYLKRCYGKLNKSHKECPSLYKNRFLSLVECLRSCAEVADFLEIDLI
jgi:uncharacterized ubiquitin-like protein YukD